MADTQNEQHQQETEAKEKTLELVWAPKPKGKSDIQVIGSEGGVLHLHTIFLLTHSKVFAAAFEYTDTDKDDVKPLKMNYPFEVLKVFFAALGYDLEFRNRLDQSNVGMVAELADKYDVHPILDACAEYVGAQLDNLPLFPHSASSQSESKADSKTEVEPKLVSLFEASVIAAKAKRNDILDSITTRIAEYYKEHAACKSKDKRYWSAEEKKKFEGFDEKSAKYCSMLDSKTTHQLMTKACTPNASAAKISSLLQTVLTGSNASATERRTMVDLLKELSPKVSMKCMVLI
jgi:hypothetical protein